MTFRVLGLLPLMVTAFTGVSRVTGQEATIYYQSNELILTTDVSTTQFNNNVGCQYAINLDDVSNTNSSNVLNTHVLYNDFVNYYNNQSYLTYGMDNFIGISIGELSNVITNNGYDYRFVVRYFASLDFDSNCLELSFRVSSFTEGIGLKILLGFYDDVYYECNLGNEYLDLYDYKSVLSNNVNVLDTFTINNSANEYLRFSPFFFLIGFEENTSDNINVFTQFNLISNSPDYALGYNDGYNVGYRTGNDEGLSVGYQNGYQTALEGQVRNYSFISLFNSVADTPLRFIYGLFNFNLFGTSVLVIVLSLLTATMVFAIIKKIWK